MPTNRETSVKEPFELPADFAARVLAEVDRRQRRRRGLGVAAGVLACALAAVAVRSGPAPRSGPTAPPARLQAADLAWLERAGVEPGDLDSLVFPDAVASEPVSEANPLVAVAENL